jgi:hypothetical protein
MDEANFHALAKGGNATWVILIFGLEVVGQKSTSGKTICQARTKSAGNLCNCLFALEALVS